MKLGAFELGGSDPFIVLDDADLDLASTKAIMGRLLCNAQACNNAKRFIIEDSVYDKFKEMFLEKLKNPGISFKGVSHPRFIRDWAG